MSIGNFPLKDGKQEYKFNGFLLFINRYDRFLTWIENFFLIIASLLLITSLLLICFSVIARFFLKINVSWTIELSEYTMLYLAFLAAPWILKNDDHIKVDVFTQRLSKKTVKVLDVFISIPASIACLLLFWFSLQATIDHFQRGVIITNVLGIYKYIPLLIIPVGSSLLFLRYTHKILLLLVPKEF